MKCMESILGGGGGGKNKNMRKLLRVSKGEV